MKRLFLDIEVAPCVVLAWKPGHKIYVHYDNIVKEREIICIGWKWQGCRAYNVSTWSVRRSDRALVGRILPIISEADEVIGHNIDKFDMPWIRGRALFHKLSVPIVRTVDTLKWARKYYNLNSNTLDYLGKFLGFGGKIEKFKHDKGSWKRVAWNNDRKELAGMAEYCKRDIELLEFVWEKLSATCPVHTHAGVAQGGEKWSCPRCGSENVFKNQKRISAKGTEQQTMQCKDCHGYYTISATARAQYEQAA